MRSNNRSVQRAQLDEVQRRAAYRVAGREVARLTCADSDRRARLEADPAAWLKWYLPEAYPLPWGEPHLRIIDGCVRAFRTGGKAAFAAPRGTGKSAIVNGMTLYGLLTGAIIFPVVLPWKSRDVKRALRFWKMALCFNDRLVADYPEMCKPFFDGKGNSQKTRNLIWADTLEPTGAELKLSEGVIVLPDGKGVIGSDTVNGNPRGLNHTTEDGRIIRPDVALIDDPQDKEAAKSQAQVESIVGFIDEDIMGMCGPDKSMAAIITCTVIRDGDVACHYLGGDTPDWQSVRISQVETWPIGWDDGDSRARDLWREWNMLRLECVEADGTIADCLRYYEDNKAAMTDGMSVSWEGRYYSDQGHPDAYFSAMWDYFKMGHAAFMSERQNRPVTADTSLYDLGPSLICSRLSGLRRGDMTKDHDMLIIGTDINHCGLHWASVAFENGLSGTIPAYGVYPGGGRDIVHRNASDVEIDKAVFNALTEMANRILDSRWTRGGEAEAKIDMWIIDGGYRHATVQRFAQKAKLPFPVVVARGYDSTKYRVTKSTLVGAPREHCHMVKSQYGRFVAFDQDHWLEVAQRAWLANLGAPGSLSIYGNVPEEHREIATQICGEKLSDKVKGHASLIYKWNVSGMHDYGDAVYMAYVGAAFMGLTTGGERRQTKRTPQRRRPKIRRLDI